MPNTFFGMTIGQSGLTAANIGVNTTAHNVSNINTKGYSRQQVDQTPSFGIMVYNTYGTVGTGVNADSITQARNIYYDNRYWTNSANEGQYQTYETYSTLIQDYLDEFNLQGFITEYNNLFKSIAQLQSNPNGEVERTQFLNYMSSICGYFNTLSTNLSNIQSDLNTEVKSSVDNINTIAAQLASLNKQINIIQANGGEANDLKDARNLLIDELSQFVNTQVKETDLGNGITDYRVFIDNQSLVDGYNYRTLEVVPREAVSGRRNASDVDGLYDIQWANTKTPFNPYETSIRGSLKALIDLRDGCNDAYERVGTDANGNQELTIEADTFRNSSYKGVPYYQAQLNTFLKTFADEFNKIILNGQLKDGTQATTPLLVSKFAEGDYVTAANISVNRKLVDDSSLLPYSYDVSQGVENNDMLLDLAALKEKVTLKSGTFWDYLTSLVSEVSVDTSRAKVFTKNYSNVGKSIEQQRQSVMGVDEDEEGVNLIKYQNAYGLASKVITVMNQIYSKLIEETGV